MRNSMNMIVGIIIIAAMIAMGGVLYTVDETQQVVVTQFGKLIGKPIKEAGIRCRPEKSV